MAIGVSIFLIAAGAILAFAVDTTAAGVDIQLVGWILMGAGVLGLLVNLVVFVPRRRREVITNRNAYGAPRAWDVWEDDPAVVSRDVTER